MQDYEESSTIAGDSYSPSVAVRLENNKVAHLTVSGVMTFALYLLVFLLVQMAASIVLAIVRRKKEAGRNIPFTAVWHCVNVLLFTFCEVSVWYFLSAYPILKVIPMVLVLVTLLVFAWKLYRQNKNGKKILSFRLYVVFLAVFGLLNGLFAGEISKAKAVILVLIYIAFFTSALILFRKECDGIRGQCADHGRDRLL